MLITVDAYYWRVRPRRDTATAQELHEQLLPGVCVCVVRAWGDVWGGAWGAMVGERGRGVSLELLAHLVAVVFGVEGTTLNMYLIVLL